jgi:hypothetical protein
MGVNGNKKVRSKFSKDFQMMQVFWMNKTSYLTAYSSEMTVTCIIKYRACRSFFLFLTMTARNLALRPHNE